MVQHQFQLYQSFLLITRGPTSLFIDRNVHFFTKRPSSFWGILGCRQKRVDTTARCENEVLVFIKTPSVHLHLSLQLNSLPWRRVATPTVTTLIPHRALQQPVATPPLLLLLLQPGLLITYQWWDVLNYSSSTARVSVPIEFMEIKRRWRIPYEIITWINFECQLTKSYDYKCF